VAARHGDREKRAIGLNDPRERETGLKPERKTKVSVYTALISMLIAGLTVGCGTGGPQESGYPSTSPAVAVSADSSQTPSSVGVLGTWEGTTLARCPGSAPGRCNAQQKISITLREDNNSTIAGSYTCAYGNQNCLRQNDSGTVTDVRLAGSRITFRVIMTDGTSCIFNGSVANNTISGGYSCYSGGLLLEQGGWSAHRAS
jgi:hypothetical protein